MTMTSVPDPLDGLLDPQNDTLFDFLDLFDGSPMPVQDPKDQLLSPSLPDIMHTAEQRARERSQDSNESSSFAPSAAGWPQPASPRQAAAEKPVSDKANKLKEKNRRAQQRFRERKKEQDRETAGRVGELSAQLKACESHKGMLQRSKWMLTAAAREKDDVLESAPRFVPARGLRGYDTSAVLQLQEAWDEPVLLSPRRIVGLTTSEFSCLWQDLAAAMVVHVPAAQREPGGPAAAKLQALVHELCALSGFMALGNSDGLSAFIEAPAHQGNAGAWGPVAASLRVQPQQRQQLLRWHQAFVATTRKLQAARTSLQAALQRAVDSGIEIGPEPNTGCTLRQLLDHNREDLQRVAFDFQSQCWVNGLSALQTAVCVVKAAPAAPDLPAIIGALQ